MYHKSRLPWAGGATQSDRISPYFHDFIILFATFWPPWCVLWLHSITYLIDSVKDMSYGTKESILRVNTSTPRSVWHAACTRELANNMFI